ncbi:MFS transporter [Prauserella sp. PE36]|uniref:MFS transporter n=1 Tax=Prauserella endophytica TaxID=1592324 RepID=A0ABY2SBA5_9PSEU|nr:MULTISPECIES: MFS transporter [Prauserella]RBM12921.1 MFS transporter [Prauserella sp. PE36]TKG73163.1 MFS transporter [Prauserella endophytica]
MAGGSLGRRFGFLWAAYAVSTFGTRFAFDAFPMIAVLVLGAGPLEVSLLAAAGLAAGAVFAVPLGPVVEFRRKRSVLVVTDLIRFAALSSVAGAFAFGVLTFAQLMVVSVVVASADIAFRAASGAYLKTLLPSEHLLVANGRFEATTWTATALGPPLGGASLGLFGPITTVVVDAVTYLLSAAGISAIGGREPRPGRPVSRPGAGEVLEGWRHIFRHPVLRPLFCNTVLFNGLLLATSPLLAVLMLGELGFPPWQYALALAGPCLGGLVGSWLAPPLVARFGRRPVLLAAGTLRVCWPIGLAFAGPGLGGLVLVLTLQLVMITCIGVFNPVFATFRLDHTPADRVARTLSAWTITSNATVAALTALWGLLAAATSVRAAIAIAGALLLATPLLLPRRATTPSTDRRAAVSTRA